MTANGNREGMENLRVDQRVIKYMRFVGARIARENLAEALDDESELDIYRSAKRLADQGVLSETKEDGHTFYEMNKTVKPSE